MHRYLLCAATQRSASVAKPEVPARSVGSSDGVAVPVVGGSVLGVNVDGAAVHTPVLHAAASAVTGHVSPAPSGGDTIVRSRLELPPPPAA